MIKSISDRGHDLPTPNYQNQNHQGLCEIECNFEKFKN